MINERRVLPDQLVLLLGPGARHHGVIRVQTEVGFVIRKTEMLDCDVINNLSHPRGTSFSDLFTTFTSSVFLVTFTTDCKYQDTE